MWRWVGFHVLNGNSGLGTESHVPSMFYILGDRCFLLAHFQNGGAARQEFVPAISLMAGFSHLPVTWSIRLPYPAFEKTRDPTYVKHTERFPKLYVLFCSFSWRFGWAFATHPRCSNVPWAYNHTFQMRHSCSLEKLASYDCKICNRKEKGTEHLPLELYLAFLV